MTGSIWWFLPLLLQLLSEAAVDTQLSLDSEALVSPAGTTAS